MTRNSFTVVTGLLVGLSLLTSAAHADNGPDALLADLAKQGKYAFLLFYRDSGPATRSLDQALAKELARYGERAGGGRFAVNDPAAKAVVEKLGIARAPMPLVVALAPNGAITGVFSRKLTPEMVDGAFVTPGMTECMKALQEKRLVLIRVAPQGTPDHWPAVATAFRADPRYKGRVSLVSIGADDEQEVRFRKDLELGDEELREPVLALLAPPGVLVGKFATTTTVGELTAKLEAATKCCDDPNCKHQKKGN